MKYKIKQKGGVDNLKDAICAYCDDPHTAYLPIQRCRWLLGGVLEDSLFVPTSGRGPTKAMKDSLLTLFLLPGILLNLLHFISLLYLFQH